MVFAAHLSCILMTWLTLQPVGTQPRSSHLDTPSPCDTYSSKHLISPQVQIAKRIGDTGELCGTPASTRYLSIELSSIIISTALFERKLSVHRICSPSICLTFIQLTCHPFTTLEKAALISMRSTPVMWPFFQAAWAVLTMMAAASMADRPFVRLNCPSLSSPRHYTCSDISPVTTFSTTYRMQLNSDMVR
jgi:hypothetical protein